MRRPELELAVGPVRRVWLRLPVLDPGPVDRPLRRAPYRPFLVAAGATPEQLGRALAFAAALRITRFHLNNDPGDWNSVHHSPGMSFSGTKVCAAPPGPAAELVCGASASGV